jgi:uncharacterized membrane protein HdeD (DUF308 family)
MWNAPPWKVSVIATVAIAAGVKLLVADWSLAGLSAFVALLLVAIGAMRILATPRFTGLGGALAALGAGGEVAVGAALLAWPRPTLLILAVVLGTWIVARSTVDGTIVITTRAGRSHWLAAFLVVVAEFILGAVLLTRPGGTARGAAVTVGAATVLQSTLVLAAAWGPRRRERRWRRTRPARSVLVMP